MITKKDLKHLKRAVELAEIALNKGEQPFGSLLVDKDGNVLFEDHNRVKDGDYTRHPEFEIAKWAMNNLKLEDREQATVYTSGEHCPMCAAAHGWASLGRIVYASSSMQLTKWLEEFGVVRSKVKPLPILEVINDTIVDGPVESLSSEVYKLQKKFYNK